MALCETYQQHDAPILSMIWRAAGQSLHAHAFRQQPGTRIMLYMAALPSNLGFVNASELMYQMHCPAPLIGKSSCLPTTLQLQPGITVPE